MDTAKYVWGACISNSMKQFVCVESNFSFVCRVDVG